jgi:perosamine synthetase
MTSPRKFIPVSMPTFLGNEKRYVSDCMDTEWISSIGKYISAFEEQFAEFCSVPHAVACNNGTTALHLALLACGVGPGDEVIVPTLTYIASANAIRYCGATPVFIDSDPRTMNLDPGQLEERISPRTKGIVVVHLYGHPVDMDPVLDIARQHNLFVIEDAAEAHGARYKGRIAGSLSDVATFSFFGNKIITTGEGGMVTTRNRELAEKIRILRGQGMDPNRRYWFPVIGYNYRMTNIQAAIGLAQLENIEQHLASRRRVAEWYNRHLQRAAAFIELPVEMPWAHHSFWMYTILLRTTAAGMSNERFREALAARGIDSRPVFYPMHTMPPYSEDRCYPVAEDLSARGLNLPTHGHLTEDDVQYIGDAIFSICSQAACA